MLGSKSSHTFDNILTIFFLGFVIMLILYVKRTHDCDRTFIFLSISQIEKLCLSEFDSVFSSALVSD